MQPDLSLRYRNHHAVSRLGVGWSLAGLPRITRLPQNVRQDGVASPVQFDAGDELALAGERLVEVPGAGR